jgi:1,4-dihydroxy-2-naphthoyl-CoA hydrolase
MAPDAAGTTTIESKTNFLRAVSSGYIVAAARPLHVGRTLIVIESEVSDDQERLIGKVIQSQLVLAR